MDYFRLNQLVKNSEVARKALNHAVEDYHDQNCNLATSLEELFAEAQEAKAYIECLKRCLGELLEDHKLPNNRRSTIESKLKTLNEFIKKLLNDRDLLYSELEAAQKVIECFTEELENAKRQAEQIEDAKNKEVEELKATIAELEDQLYCLEQNHSELTELYEQLSKPVGSGGLDNIHSEVERLRAEFEMTKSEKERLEDSSKCKDQQINDLLQQLEQLERVAVRTKESLEQEIECLAAAIMEEKKINQSLRCDLDKRTDEVEILTRNLERADAENERLCHENKCLRNELQEELEITTKLNTILDRASVKDKFCGSGAGAAGGNGISKCFC